MDKQTLIKKIKAMSDAPSCCPELTAAAQIYIDAIGTAKEKSAAEDLIAEIEEDVTDIDHLVAFTHSERAKEIFGEEGQKNFAAHADELKAGGAKYCDCDACAYGLEILQYKDILTR
ncbi:MAG: heat-shock protein Hsp90 [Selenomonadaceae bacterium]|nr:heat-shock protein Hsp90 [Selenomonadaceae bacterium]